MVKLITNFVDNFILLRELGYLEDNKGIAKLLWACLNVVVSLHRTY
jgi:hypothetical protein